MAASPQPPYLGALRSKRLKVRLWRIRDLGEQDGLAADFDAVETPSASEVVAEEAHDLSIERFVKRRPIKSRV